MNRWSRAFLGALLLVVVALVASACGGDKPVDAVQVLAAAPDKTVAESTARVAGEMTIEAQGNSTQVSYDGVMELRGGRGTMTMDASSFGLPKGKIEMRIVDGTMYMDFGSLADAIGEKLPAEFGGKRWLSIDMSKLTQGAQALQNDPTAASTSSLEYLRGVDADGIETMGDESVRGEPTTHYRADVDLGTLKKKLQSTDMSDSAREYMERGLDAIDGTTLGIDTWIDHDGRVRRQEIDEKLRVQSRSAHLLMRMEYYDFGVKLDVEKPAASDVFSLGDFASLGS
jgi:hypothetical protein